MLIYSPKITDKIKINNDKIIRFSLKNTKDKYSASKKKIPYEKKKKRKCCGGILVYVDDKNDDYYILAVKGKVSNKWGLPKGGIEENESYKQCAIREIKEETSLDINIICDRNTKIHNTYYYIVPINEKNDNLKPLDKNEIVEVKWIKVAEIKKLETNREIKMIPNKFNLIKKIVTRMREQK